MANLHRFDVHSRWFFVHPGPGALVKLVGVLLPDNRDITHAQTSCWTAGDCNEIHAVRAVNKPFLASL